MAPRTPITKAPSGVMIHKCEPWLLSNDRIASPLYNAIYGSDKIHCVVSNRYGLARTRDELVSRNDFIHPMSEEFKHGENMLPDDDSQTPAMQESSKRDMDYAGGAPDDDARDNGGSTPSQYALPVGAKELQDLIEYRGMNFAVGNIFKACYRLGHCDHSTRLRDMNKIVYFANREVDRLKKYGDTNAE